jgi:hypothetical protein
MAYKPQNVAKYRDDSSDYPKGSTSGKGGGTVPGTTGSNDRGSQAPWGKNEAGSFYNDGNVAHGSGDYNLLGTDNLNSRTKANFGKASYNYKEPSLMPDNL